MQTDEKIISNSIGATIDINNESVNCRIKIRLNDECKNGHEDFSITATFWTPKKARIDQNYECGGCCHDEILALRPDLKPFVDLHLSDWEGRPMHGFANGFYFLEQGKDESVISTLRLKDGELDTLKQAADKKHFAYLCQKMKLPERWKGEAVRATALLEKLGGDVYKFQSTAKRPMFELLTRAEMAELAKVEKSGYYSTEQVNERKEAAKKAAFDKEMQKLIDERSAAHSKANAEFLIKSALLTHFGKPVNAIYYGHKNTIKFNWLDYGAKVQKSEVENFIFNQHSYELPEGLNIEY